MRTFVRGELPRGTRVAVGLPLALMLCVGGWVGLHGFAIGVGPAAVVAFAFVCAAADRLEIVLTSRVSASPGGDMAVAAGLVGGPLVGAIAGVATQMLNTDRVWRRRSTWAAHIGLNGFAAGIVGHAPWTGAGGAARVAALALLAAGALSVGLQFLVALDRQIPLGEWAGAAFRTLAIEAPLALPVLAAFLYVYRSAPLLAFPELIAVLVMLALVYMLYGRVARQLASERLRARRDALTGAPNRHALAEALAAEEARVLRGTQPAGVLFIDLDLFREVNNTHGYATGDELLVAVYERLSSTLRVSDTAFRWGGEEFVVLAPELGDEKTLAAFADRVRVAISETPLTKSELSVTASVGGTLLTDARSAQETLELASRLVRVAKQTRNATVTRAESLDPVSMHATAAVRVPT
jgi:diguanylate cyclase (GGDEF)-like protein